MSWGKHFNIVCIERRYNNIQKKGYQTVEIIIKYNKSQQIYYLKQQKITSSIRISKFMNVSLD